MEFRKMVMITLYVKQKKRHRCIEQTFEPCGRRRGWDVSREQHQSMYIIYGETDHQPRLDAWDNCSDLGALGRPRGIGWRGRWEGGLGWGIHVNPWLIHVNVWQKPLQYCKVISLQLKKKKKKELHCLKTYQTLDKLDSVPDESREERSKLQGWGDQGWIVCGVMRVYVNRQLVYQILGLENPWFLSSTVYLFQRDLMFPNSSLCVVWLYDSCGGRGEMEREKEMRKVTARESKMIQF